MAFCTDVAGCAVAAVCCDCALEVTGWLTILLAAVLAMLAHVEADAVEVPLAELRFETAGEGQAGAEVQGVYA